MKRYTIAIGLLMCLACQSKTEKKVDTDYQTTDVTGIIKMESGIDYSVAEQFINDYVVLESNDVEQWVQNHTLLSNNFKARYSALIDSARRAEPEIGLGFDPVVDGQDFPNQLSILEIDSLNGYVTLQGVDWEDFQLVMKVIYENNQSLIEGSGIINIPEGKQATR